ncbi:hypothetical protein NSP_37060 [Nodularia spumigena CCY9414]|nr:hypothetical protein NSP_37060 [Nodularia spumigena CCY9414]
MREFFPYVLTLSSALYPANRQRDRPPGWCRIISTAPRLYAPIS